MVITPRDAQVLKLEKLYGVITREAVWESLFCGVEMNAVSKVLARLCKKGLLRSYPLVGKSRYYRAGDPLGPLTLPYAYAVMHFCVFTDRPKLSAVELRQNLPWLNAGGLAYCVDGESFCQLRIDRGGDADALVRKVRNHHRATFHVDDYRSLVASGRWCVRIITATQHKADEINRYLAMDPPPFDVVPVVIPDLIHLL